MDYSPERLTVKIIDALEPPAKGYRIKYDRDPKGRATGLGVRVTDKGAKSFILNYRNREGRERRYTIGRFGPGAWSLEAARKRARDLRTKIDSGGDPLADEKDVKAAPTVADLAKRYVEEHAEKHKRPSSIRDDKAMIKKIIKPKLGNKKVASVDYGDIDKLHQSMKATPYRANRVLALLSKMFSLAQTRWRMRPDNPCKGIARFDEPARERPLERNELTRLLKILDKRDDKKLTDAIRLTILTGARIGEVINAPWSQFDLAAGLWVKPSAHTKQKKIHRVPLSAAARQLLKNRLKDSKSDYVFPGRSDAKPLEYKEINEFWRDVRKEAKIEDVRLHDLRHTYATSLASEGQSLQVIGALLGHTQAQTTLRYAHIFDDALRKATNQVGRAYKSSTRRKSGKVVSIKKGAA